MAAGSVFRAEVGDEHGERARPARVGALASGALTFGAFGLALTATFAAPASAQTLKENLQQHMQQGIEEEKKKNEEQERREAEEAQKPKPKPKPEAAPPPEAKAAPPGENAIQFSFDSRDSAPEPEAPQKPDQPQLPIRVIGKNLQLDVIVGAGYRGWLPQSYQAVDVKVGNYATWSIDVKAKFFHLVSLKRGYYESNGVASPHTEDAAVAAKIGSYAPKAMRALGILGVPISKAWEPQVRYEAYGFETRALPEKNVCIVDRSASGSATGCPGTMGELKIVSAFETLVAGVQYDHSKSDATVVGPKTGKIPPIFFGVGLMQYRKPYQVNVNGNALTDYLFDSRFRGIGLALGTEFGGGVDRIYGDVSVQLGAGEVSLSDHLKLNDVIPNGYTIGYVQGTATVGYRLALLHVAPTLILQPSVSLGGADFFLVATNNPDDKAPSPSVNWDFLWSAQVSLLLPL